VVLITKLQGREEGNMPAAGLPANEAERLAALRSYDVLDTGSEAAYDDIAALAAQLAGTSMALVSLVDAGRAYHKAGVGGFAVEAPREHTFCGHAILEAPAPMIVPDATQDPRFADNPYVAGAPGIRFYAGFPLVSPEGAALGTLCVFDLAPRDLSAAQRSGLEKLAETTMTTLELRRAMIHIRRLALADPLTGLPNRTALLDALERAIARQRRHGGTFALLYFDLDNFKQVNDRHGHAVGDACLREMAAALTANVRREDVAARLGGDEFALLAVEPDQHIERLAERIRGEILRGMQAHSWPVSASIGAVVFMVPPASTDAVLSAADAAMYAAKNAGKNRVVVHEPPPAA
jgi:diguanylate cyclase (GGDEF)-like protein